MAKMKYFSAAMAIVRKSSKGKDGKMKNRKLAGSVSRLLGALRAKKIQIADEIARGIVSDYGK